MLSSLSITTQLDPVVCNIDKELWKEDASPRPQNEWLLSQPAKDLEALIASFSNKVAQGLLNLDSADAVTSPHHMIF